MVRIGAFFFSAIAFLMSSSVFASDKPNIIVMVADDLGWADVGFTATRSSRHPRSIALPPREPSLIGSTPLRSARRRAQP